MLCHAKIRAGVRADVRCCALHSFPLQTTTICKHLGKSLVGSGDHPRWICIYLCTDTMVHLMDIQPPRKSVW